MYVDINKDVNLVIIHPSDTYSMFVTLAHIVHPMLVQLKATSEGYPDNISIFDTPIAAASDEERWDYVLDEMIWAFEFIRDYYDDFNVSKEADYIRAQNGLRLFAKYYFDLWD